MVNRSVFQVVDGGDKTSMMITTEWINDETVKLAIMREGKIPLSGESTLERLITDYKRDSPREKCLEELRDELSGRDEGVQFVLRASKLLWKRKAWWKGGVEVRPVEDILELAEMSLHWLHEQADLLRRNSQIQEECETLRINVNDFEAKLQAAEILKKSMEDVLYQKFVLVLNEKKKKIRELEERLRSHEDRDTAYNAETDDSEPENHPEKTFDQNLPSTSRGFEPMDESRPESQESEQSDIVLRLEESPDFIS